MCRYGERHVVVGFLKRLKVGVATYLAIDESDESSVCTLSLAIWACDTLSIVTRPVLAEEQQGGDTDHWSLHVGSRFACVAYDHASCFLHFELRVCSAHHDLVHFH